MARLAAALFSLLVFVAAHAEDKPAPMEPVNTAGVIIFLVLFFGTIVAYAVYLWIGARKKKTDESQ